MHEQLTVKTNTGARLILASPGTGKRNWLVSRFLELLRAGVEPEKIFCMTFTRRVGSQLIQQIARAAKIDSARLWGQILTFHNLGLKILCEEGRVNTGVGHHPIITETDQRQIIEKILDTKGFHCSHIDCATVREYISDKKPSLQTPAACLSRACHIQDYRNETLNEAHRLRTLAEVYQEYERTLQERSLADWYSLVYESYLLLAGNPAVLAKYQERFEHVMVDEWQWTTPAERALTSLLARNAKSFLAVADSAQMASIGSRVSEYQVAHVN
jgi:DNA helicase-2/ATP-dependent DNA helicase PcrA